MSVSANDDATTQNVWTAELGWRRLPNTMLDVDGPTTGWTRERGWFQFDETAVIDEDDDLSASVRSSNNGNGYNGYGNGYNGYGNQYNQWSNWNDNNTNWNNNNTRPENKKDGDVPEWDGFKDGGGKSMTRFQYFRKIDLWESTTGVKPEDRALRLVQKLSGDAFDKTENIKVETLQCSAGVEKFKAIIEEAYEPIEDYRVGKVMDEFIDTFDRKRDQ